MPKKLLLADDSITIRKVIGITFANEDYDLTVVDNGADCVKKAIEIKPDLILADVVMPEKNGYEVCREVKNYPGLAHVPVILLTGTFENFDEAKSREAGADDYITKPFESQTLIDKVKTLLVKSASASPAETATSGPSTVADENRMEKQDTEQPELDEMALEDDIVDLSDDEIWEVTGEDTASDEDLFSETPGKSAEAEDAWSIEEFEEAEIEPLGAAGDEGPADEEAISDEDLWGGMEFGGIEETAPPEQVKEERQAAEEPVAVAPMGNDIFAAEEKPENIDQAAIDEFDEFADFAEVTSEQDDEVAEIEEPDAEGDGLFEFDEMMAEISPEASQEEAVQAADIVPDEEMFDIEAEEERPTEIDEEIMEEREPTPVELAPEPFIHAATPEDAEKAAASISEAQIEAIVAKVAKEVIERIAWEIVPELAETLIVEEIKKLKENKNS